MKTCKSCKLDKSLAEFHKFKNDPSRIGNWCETCYTSHNAKQTERLKLRRERLPAK